MELSVIKNYVAAHADELLSLTRELAKIPAPSHKEQKRAEFIKHWLEKFGGADAYIDSALNVILPINCDGKNGITAFCAHTDTVFPDEDKMAYSEDEEYIYCPGIGDNTASATILMMCAKYYLEKGIRPEGGVIFLFNSCEEGLGNLKGVRRFFEDYSGRIGSFIAFDSRYTVIHDRCVGSHRYNVTVKTQGGHSYANFGRKNAIAELSRLACAIYDIDMPKKEGKRVTCNIGIISGGTSVNTIAQNASMLCEYRSDDLELLDYMRRQFDKIFEGGRSDEVQVKVELIGERPCAAQTDGAAVSALVSTAAEIMEEVVGEAPKCSSASTDCNIPASLGVPAVCVGVCNFTGAHTREERLEKASLPKGYEIALRLIGTLT